MFTAREIPSMTPIEELELPPWTKWSRFRIFPSKLLIHICLVILVTAQAFVLNESFATYSRAMNEAVVDLLFPEGNANNDLSEWLNSLGVLL
jgi:hypothetical protein